MLHCIVMPKASSRYNRTSSNNKLRNLPRRHEHQQCQTKRCTARENLHNPQKRQRTKYGDPTRARFGMTVYLCVCVRGFPGWNFASVTNICQKRSPTTLIAGPSDYTRYIVVLEQCALCIDERVNFGTHSFYCCTVYSCHSATCLLLDFNFQ
jgi:hypothetical protein